MIRTRFLVPCLIAVVVSLAALVGVSSWGMSNGMTSLVKGQLRETTNLLSRTTADWLRDRRSDVEAWSERQSFWKAVGTTFLAQANREVTNLQINQIVANYPSISAVHLLDRTGTVLLSSEGSEAASLPVSKIRTIMFHGGGDRYEGAVDNGNRFYMAHTLMNGDTGKTVGALVVTFNIDDLRSSRFADVTVGKRGGAGLRTGLRQIVAHVTPAMTTLDTYTVDGITLVRATAPVEGVPWVVDTYVPASEVNEPAVNLAMRMLMIGIAMVALLTAIILVLVDRLTSPIARLRETIAAIADGNLDEAVPGVERHDEIGSIAVSVEMCRQALQRKRLLKAEIAEDQQATMLRRRKVEEMVERFRLTAEELVGGVEATALAEDRSASDLVMRSKQKSDEVRETLSVTDQTSVSIAAAAASARALMTMMSDLSGISNELAERGSVVVNAGGSPGSVIKLAGTAPRTREFVTLIEEISTHLQAAAEGTGTLREHIGEMSLATTQVTSSAESVAAASGALVQRARVLKSEVDSFLKQVAAD